MADRDRANVPLQVLPFDTGAHPSMVGPFTMMTFLDPATLVSYILNITPARFSWKHPGTPRVRGVLGRNSGQRVFPG